MVSEACPTNPREEASGLDPEAVHGSGIESAKNCAGTHIHFGQDDAVDQINVLTALDPALALVSSSNYYTGVRGANSARALAYRESCGEEFRCYTGLWDYADSIEEWRNRVDEKYEKFKRLAADRGVSHETVEALFSPEDTVLNPVRLRECQPTVEWRAPDATLPSQIVQLATDVESLVSHASTASVEHGSPEVSANHIQIPAFDRLCDLSLQAIQSGLGATEVRGYLRALGFDTEAYEPIVSQLDGGKQLSEAEARARRLEQANRLQDDIDRLDDEGSRYPMFPA